MSPLNTSTPTERASSPGGGRPVRNPKAGDRLFRNDGGHFTDVSAQAGIYGGGEGDGPRGGGSDFNLHGGPPPYIANDFPEKDFLYFNNCDGTFTETIAPATRHTTPISMGVDA